MGPAAFRALLDRFYREATNVLVAHDAVLDKFVGDEVVALFLPVLNGHDHASDAIDAARELLRATGHGSAAGPWIPLGAGVHTGLAYVGSIGDTVTAHGHRHQDPDRLEMKTERLEAGEEVFDIYPDR